MPRLPHGREHVVKSQEPPVKRVADSRYLTIIEMKIEICHLEWSGIDKIIKIRLGTKKKNVIPVINESLKLDEKGAYC